MPPVGSKRLALTCGNESIGLLMPLGTASLQQTVTTPISKAKSELHFICKLLSLCVNTFRIFFIFYASHIFTPITKGVLMHLRGLKL